MKIFIFCSNIFWTLLKNFSWVQYGCSRYESHPTHKSKYFWKKLPPQNLFFGGWQFQWLLNLIWRDVYPIFSFFLAASKSSKSSFTKKIRARLRAFCVTQCVAHKMMIFSPFPALTGCERGFRSRNRTRPLLIYAIEYVWLWKWFFNISCSGSTSFNSSLLICIPT